jgi:hypothetical protein
VGIKSLESEGGLARRPKRGEVIQGGYDAEDSAGTADEDLRVSLPVDVYVMHGFDS